MGWRRIDYDPEARLEVSHYYDEMTDTTTIREMQDVKPLIDYNVAVQNATPTKMGVSDLFRKGVKESWAWVARIPAGVELQWKQQGIDIWKWGRDDWTTRKIKQLLNSRANYKLRTGVGKI